MRYIILVIMSILSVLISGSVTSGLTIMGIQVDLVLLIALSFALAEKGAMPIIWAAATGLFMDALYSMSLGPYALSYAIATAAAVFILSRFEKINILILFLVGAGGFLIKELVLAGVSLGQGANIDGSIFAIFARETLPGMLLNGALLFVAYWLIGKLMKREWMRPRPSYNLDEF
ncbi:MAG: rod shape-determining protein MreD [Christensenella sp.]|nr:rod shape-determining protein MreD [Christensenella sp.]